MHVVHQRFKAWAAQVVLHHYVIYQPVSRHYWLKKHTIDVKPHNLYQAHSSAID